MRVARIRKFSWLVCGFVAAGILFVVGCGQKAAADKDISADASAQDEATRPQELPEAGTDGSGEAGGRGDSVPSFPPFDWCQPDKPPDAQCHAAKRDPQSEFVKLARAIADKQLALHPPEEVKWNWEEAVLMQGLVELYRVTGEGAYRDYFQTWMDHHIEKGIDIQISDTCAPTAVAVALFELTGHSKYEQVAQQALDYLYNQALRTTDGGISHMGTIPIVTLWVDSLFMFGNVLIGWGESQDDQPALAEFSAQYALFGQHLQADGGFYVHAAQWPDPVDDDIFWARGNGWVAAAAANYLRVRRNRGETDAAVEVPFLSLLAAARQAQDVESGLWWTIMNHPGKGYRETSAAALFAYAQARAWRYGLADDEALACAQAAMDGVLARIQTDFAGVPTVTGTSGPTTAGTLEKYLAVPQADDIPYGIGAVLLALTEMSGLPDVR